MRGMGTGQDFYSIHVRWTGGSGFIQISYEQEDRVYNAFMQGGGDGLIRL